MSCVGWEKPCRSEEHEREGGPRRPTTTATPFSVSIHCAGIRYKPPRRRLSYHRRPRRCHPHPHRKLPIFRRGPASIPVFMYPSFSTWGIPILMLVYPQDLAICNLPRLHPYAWPVVSYGVAPYVVV